MPQSYSNEKIELSLQYILPIVTHRHYGTRAAARMATNRVKNGIAAQPGMEPRKRKLP
jgi:hypothetical protein